MLNRILDYSTPQKYGEKKNTKKERKKEKRREEKRRIEKKYYILRWFAT